MGLFSSIGKFFKKIWKGVKKVFKAIMKPITKLLGSDLGKVLMLGVSIFTMGTSLLAGAKGFMEGTGFIGKFLNGGKEFLNSLLGTQFETAGNQAAGAAGTGGAVTEGAANLAAENTVQAGEVLTGGDPTGMGAITDAATGAAPVAPGAAPPPSIPGATPPPAMGPTQALADAGGMLATRTPPAESGNWLSKAANAALDFAKTPGGANIIGNVIGGVGAGMQQKEMNRFNSRVERMFEDPNNPGMRMLREHDYSVDVPRGLAGASSRYAQRLNENSGRYTPHIPFRRPAPAGG